MKKLISVLLVSVLLLIFVFQSVAETAPVTYTDKDVQLNLSGMSGTVVYSMVYNIMASPEKFLGMVIRIEGYYDAFEDTELGMVYHACVIPDATSCCAQGIEFVWAGEHVYPDDYPEFGTDMIVTGRLESYFEGEYMFLHLVDADVAWKTPML